jgi:hypothetical protein
MGREPQRTIMSSNSVTFAIGTADDLTPLFAYNPAGVPLADGIAHTLNQSVLRDLFFGAWAQVWLDDTANQYQVRITSPKATDDLSGYAPLITSFIQAVRTGLGIYNANRSKLPPTGVSFLPPFGLSVLKCKSVQLLHYPPSETSTYMDYLYSPTNRRWENLLGWNDYPGDQNTLVESIVDVIPIAADGGSSGSSALAPVANAFVAYVQQMLSVLLRPTPGGQSTQPVVAYGGPVMQFLQTNFSQPNLSVLSPISLPLLSGGPSTPVLCANHPSRFFYYKPGQEAAYKAILVQDLKAAGWQAEMSQNPDLDPKQVLQDVSSYWDRNSPLVDQIFQEQVTEFEG